MNFGLHQMSGFRPHQSMHDLTSGTDNILKSWLNWRKSLQMQLRLHKVSPCIVAHLPSPTVSQPRSQHSPLMFQDQSRLNHNGRAHTWDTLGIWNLKYLFQVTWETLPLGPIEQLLYKRILSRLRVIADLSNT